MDVAVLVLFLAIVLSLVGGVIFAVLDESGRDRTAVAKAEALLRTHLSEDELNQLQRSGALHVPSPHHPGRVYVVRANGGRVTVRVNGCPEFELCVRPRELLPGREHVLAHKLMIEAAEDEYMGRANVVWRAGQAATMANRGWWD